MINETQIEQVIRKNIDCEHVEVQDTSNGCGTNFQVVIVSEDFEGQSTLARHRKVNDILKVEIGQMHAFTQKSYTPKQYRTAMKNTENTL